MDYNRVTVGVLGQQSQPFCADVLMSSHPTPLLPVPTPTSYICAGNVFADSNWVSKSASHCLNTNWPIRPPVLYMWVSLDKGDRSFHSPARSFWDALKI